MNARAIPFDTRRDCEAQFLAVVAAAQHSLRLFDPDGAVFALGTIQVDAALRAFLQRGGTLRLALHEPGHIERHCPRFLRLLRDYGHACECRQSPKNLRQLTDSFCIADEQHVVRRFHSDHMRGEANFDDPRAVDVPHHRFEAIWEASRPTLHPTTTGL